MCDNDWILMLKMGAGGDNCTKNNDGSYSCNYLYATSSNPNLVYKTNFTVDSTNSANPAYQFYQLTQQFPNNYVTWNDQGSVKSCDGETGGAHDKGGLVVNDNMSKGVYLQSSNPFWGFFSDGFLKSGSAKHPGIQTQLMQHLLFVNLKTSNDVQNMISAMNYANLCVVEGKINGFQGCNSSCPQVPTLKLENVVLSSGIKIYAKGRGERGNDIWGELNKELCNGSGMKVYTYCTPKCPHSSDKTPINNITDVMNSHYGHSVLNTDCGLDFDEFHTNHSKMGICNNNNNVVIGGNNHSVDTQGPRGGLFVVINDSNLHQSLDCLFK